MVVHARVETALSVAGHSMSGKRDNGNVLSRPHFAPAYGHGRFHAVHLRHLDVHQDKIVGLHFQCGDSFRAGGRD